MAKLTVNEGRRLPRLDYKQLRELPEGTLVRIVSEEGAYRGCICMRVSSTLYTIRCDGKLDSWATIPPFEYEVLPQGSTVTLEQTYPA